MNCGTPTFLTEYIILFWLCLGNLADGNVLDVVKNYLWRFTGTTILEYDSVSRRFIDKPASSPTWSAWSQLKQCSVSCGAGYTEKTRTCSTGKDRDCAGQPWEVTTCTEKACAANVVWSAWSQLKQCSVSCGTGVTAETRTCSTGNDRDCAGQPWKVITCTGKACAATQVPTTATVHVSAVWSAWSQPNQCSVSCGAGYTEKTRTCSTGNIGDCAGRAWEVNPCIGKACAVDGGWGRWQNWATCSESCGNGARQRHRICDNPLPQYNGRPCQGDTNETDHCHLTDCPLWSAWFYGACSVTCGRGIKQGLRHCSSGADRDCSGPTFKNETCQDKICPVDGGWGTWHTWTACSESCGNGVKKRHRVCDNPLPQYNGRPCQADAKETIHCHTADCAHWSSFNESGPCSVTCGQGAIQLKRVCSTGNNHDCSGSPYDEKPCYKPKC